jgi:hypothetical protein
MASVRGTRPRYEPGAISAAAQRSRIFGRAHARDPGVDRPLPRRWDPTRTPGSSIYPAVQSMLLAALKGGSRLAMEIRRLKAECAPTALAEAFATRWESGADSN